MDINFDKHNKYESPNIYLCNPNKKQLCTVQGLNSTCVLRLNSLSDISLEVRQTIQNIKGETIKQPCYDLLEGKRLLFVEGIGYFEIKKVVENDDDTGVYKTVTAESHQVVLQNKNISTEEKVYLFYNSADPLDENYNPDDASSVPSIVGQLYQQVGIKVELQDQDNAATQDNDVWTITYIDDELRYGDGDADGVYRSFKENTTNSYDFMVNEVESAFEAIWIFDYMYHTIQIKTVNNITVPTDIYLSFDNLLNTVEVTEDASNIVTVLNCTGSDLDIRTVNPMGTNYLVNFDYYKDPNGKWMSEELISALDEWKALYDSKVSIYKELVLQLRSQYGLQTENNRIVQESQLKIDELSQARDQYIMNYPLLAETVYQTEMSSDINSELYAEALNVNKVYTCYKKSPSVENQKYVFSGLCQARALDISYDDGYIYFQDNDTSTYCKIIKSDDGRYGYERYGQYNAIIEWCDCSEKTGIVIAAEQVRIDNTSLLIGSQFYDEAFTKNITQDFTCYESAPDYKDGIFQFNENALCMTGTFDECSYDNYLYFIDVSGKTYCKIDINVEIIDGEEHFFASGFTRFTLINEATTWIELHEQYNGLATRNNEEIQVKIDNILADMKSINLVCNIQKYIKSKDTSNKLLNELESYWVEGDYENTNLAVLDDTTMEDVLDLATELKDDGEKQLARMSQPSFSFTISAIDFLKQIKFKKFATQLKLGRVITIEKSEGVLYTPAVTEFGFNLDNGEELTLTFSNSARLNSNDFTFADLVVSSAKVTKSVTSNWQDLIEYTKHKEEISSLIANPLNRSLRAGLTNMANQEFTVDQTGILGRKYTDDSKVAFSDEQMRIMNNTILFTDDNWASVKTALGRIYYNDENGVEKTAYGLVAQTIIGDLMMSEALRISNEDNSIVLDKYGICIKSSDKIVFNADNLGNVSLTGRIEALEGYIGDETSGFTINSNSLYCNLSDETANQRVLICTGSTEEYQVTNSTIMSGWMLLAGTNFGVTNTGELYANSGYISDLIIDNGLKGRNNDVQTFSLDSNGLIINSSLAKIQVGNFQTFYDAATNNTYWQTNGALYIQGMESNTAITGIELMTDNGTDVINPTITLTVMTAPGYDSEDNARINACLTTNVRLYYPVTYTIYYRTGQSDYIDGNTVRSRTFTLYPGQDSSDVQFMHISDWTRWKGNEYIQYGLTDSACRSGTKYRMTTYSSWTNIMTVANIQQTRSQNNIKIMGNLIPKSSNLYSLGNSSVVWSAVYAQTGEILSSDINKKKDINTISEKYDLLFEKLKPVSYKFIENTSDRTHIGFIAQDVKNAILESGLTTQDFAGYCEWLNSDEEFGCGLRYEEFIALCIKQIQELKQRINTLENNNKEAT